MNGIDMSALPAIEVCFGPECSDKGSRELAKELEGLLGARSSGDIILNSRLSEVFYVW